MHGLPDRIETSVPESHPKKTDVITAISSSQESSVSAIVVNSALLARIEVLESEKKPLEAKLLLPRNHFRIEQIQHDDELVHFYTGCASFFVLNAFFYFSDPLWTSFNIGMHERNFVDVTIPRSQFLSINCL